MDALHNIKQHLEADAESVLARIKDDLPAVEKVVQDAASNPVVAAVSAAAHLPAVPGLMQVLADAIASIDNALGDAKAAASQPQAPAPADDQPAPVAPTA